MKNILLRSVFAFLIGSFMHTPKAEVVEWAPFELLDGISDAALFKAAEAVEKGFLSQQPGYLNRSLLKGNNNHWVDIIYWQTEQHAQLAAEKAMKSAICFEYFALMKQPVDPSISPVQHFEIVKSWSPYPGS